MLRKESYSEVYRFENEAGYQGTTEFTIDIEFASETNRYVTVTAYTYWSESLTRHQVRQPVRQKYKTNSDSNYCLRIDDFYSPAWLKKQSHGRFVWHIFKKLLDQNCLEPALVEGCLSPEDESEINVGVRDSLWKDVVGVGVSSSAVFDVEHRVFNGFLHTPWNEGLSKLKVSLISSNYS